MPSDQRREHRRDAQAVGAQQLQQPAQVAPAALLAGALARPTAARRAAARAAAPRRRHATSAAHAAAAIRRARCPPAATAADAHARERHSATALLALARLLRQEHVLGQALLDDLAVQLRLLQQFLVVALRDDPTVVEHDDLIRQRDRGEAVGDHERRASRHRLGERQLDALLGRGVHRGGRVVEHQHARVGQQRARDRDALALAARDRQAALADLRVVALGAGASRSRAPGRGGRPLRSPRSGASGRA